MISHKRWIIDQPKLQQKAMLHIGADYATEECVTVYSAELHVRGRVRISFDVMSLEELELQLLWFRFDVLEVEVAEALEKLRNQALEDIRHKFAGLMLDILCERDESATRHDDSLEAMAYMNEWRFV